MIALLNMSVLGFSFVFHDKAKRTQQENLLIKGYALFLLKEGVKNRYFTVRLAVSGGVGVAARLAMTVSKCENFDPFFH